LRFSKWHALGNDYLLVERADAQGPLDGGLVQRLCAVHTGIGADGVLEVAAVDGATAEIVIWNPDGSTAELSGNGVRIAARWLALRSGQAEMRVVAGGRTVVARLRSDGLVETELGRVDVFPAEVLDVGSEQVEVIPVRVGNPHAVVRREPRREELLRLGPLLERHERFPERTNVQLVRVDGTHEVTAAVWERGVGETLASGTSSTAVAAAAVANDWCQSPVNVALPGGELQVTLDDGLHALLVGPAQEICRGELSPEWLEVGDSPAR
jgi:diaminopimelate epimerase